MEIHLNDRIAQVNIVESDGHSLKVEIDGKIYELDFALITEGTYSFLFEGKSIEMELSKTDQPKSFEIKHQCYTYNTEVVDAEAKYLKNRKQSDIVDNERVISSPMPGKVIKIPINIGDEVEPGQTLIIISAMKMESEYKAKKKGVIKEILTKEEATIEGNQPLIIIE